ncbi:MAG: hypothetical protein L0387_21525 [Acidobacteria bacterium]|nr:hypothetical protein [Acidobacteriota bacterium]
MNRTCGDQCDFRGRTIVRFHVLTGTVVALGISDPVRAEWAVIGEQKTSYTTDALQFSAARRLRFSEDPSLPTALDLEQEQDVIWEPSLEVIRRFASTAGQPELSFKARGFIYTLNPIFNHGDYRLQWRQAVASGTSLLVRYRYVPNLFLGPNFERRTGERFIEEERVTTHKWRMELERRFSERWQGTLVVRYGLRLYNEPFAERDTQFWTVGPKIDLVATSWATVTLGYLYERGLAEGRNQPQFTDDVSYHLHHISLGTELRFSPPLSVALIYTYQRKDFTSDFVGDTHFGRLDQTHQGLAELAYRLPSACALSLGFQRTQRSSTFALRGFHDTIVYVGIRYAF